MTATPFDGKLKLNEVSLAVPRKFLNNAALSANIHETVPTNNLALNGTVNGRDLQVTGKDIPQAVKVPALDLTMTPQDIRSGPFTATSGATTLAGQMSIAQYTSPSPTVDAT